MNIQKIELKSGMKVKILWVDGEKTEGTFVAHERGYIIVECSGSIHACLPNHLEHLEIISDV